MRLPTWTVVLALLGYLLGLIAMCWQLNRIEADLVELERRTWEIKREGEHAWPYIRHIHRAVCPAADHDLEEEPR